MEDPRVAEAKSPMSTIASRHSTVSDSSSRMQERICLGGERTFPVNASLIAITLSEYAPVYILLASLKRVTRLQSASHPFCCDACVLTSTPYYARGSCSVVEDDPSLFMSSRRFKMAFL